MDARQNQRFENETKPPISSNADGQFFFSLCIDKSCSKVFGPNCR